MTDRETKCGFYTFQCTAASLLKIHLRVAAAKLAILIFTTHFTLIADQNGVKIVQLPEEPDSRRRTNPDLVR